MLFSFPQSYSFIAKKANKTTRKRPLRSIKMSQEAYLIIRVYKTGRTPPFSVWKALWGLCPYIGRTKYTPSRSSCLQPLFFATAYSWDACHSQVVAPHPHCRQVRSVVAHPCHIPWNVQSISKGRHGAGSPLAVPSYPQWNALLVAADAHSQHTDNSSSRAYPQSISQQLPHAQKVASLPAAPCAGQGSADRTGRIHKVKWKNLSFASITFLVARRCRLILALFSLVVETKG